MSGDEPKTSKIPGRQVTLLAVLFAAGCALFYGGMAQLPKRYLYTDTSAAAAETSRAETVTGEANPPPNWLHDPLAVCAECHTPKEAERFRKIITPLLAAQFGGYRTGAVSGPETSHASPPVPGPALAPPPASSAALAESN